MNITNHYKNTIINFSSYLLNFEEQFLKLTSNWQVTRGEKSIHQKVQQYSDEIGHDIQQLTVMRKLPQKIIIKSARINKLEAELKRKNMHGQFARCLDQFKLTKSDVLLLLEHGFIKKYIPWYQHQPTQVAENNSTKFLWNFSIQTDHEVINNKPAIIVVDKINKTANLIEVAVPNDYNIYNKRQMLQSFGTYANLSGEIKTLWNLSKVQITLVIVGAMGTFYKNFDDDISKRGLMNNKFRV